MLRPALFLCGLFAMFESSAENHATLGIEARHFWKESPYSGAATTSYSPIVSIRGRSKIFPSTDLRWDITARWDSTDAARRYANLSTAKVTHNTKSIKLSLGMDRVYWGVAESTSLINIINQRDRTGDPTGREVLGQAVASATYLADSGSLSVYLLPYFQRMRFHDPNSRLRSVALDHLLPESYESGAERRHLDWAVRWSGNHSDFDWGAYYFKGTSREPRILATNQGLRPHYEQIEQVGIEAQLTKGSWLWKYEGFVRWATDDAFMAFILGFEYTFYSIAGSSVDAGFVAEYLRDSRDFARSPVTVHQDDTFLGMRITTNNSRDTSILLGAFVDHDNQDLFGRVEISHRLSNRWTAKLKANYLARTDPQSILEGIASDSFLELNVNYHF